MTPSQSESMNEWIPHPIFWMHSFHAGTMWCKCIYPFGYVGKTGNLEQLSPVKLDEINDIGSCCWGKSEADASYPILHYAQQSEEQMEASHSTNQHHQTTQLNTRG